MRYVVRARIRTLLAQQSGHIQLLIFAPILTLFVLSLVVRTANSAIDPTLEKKKVTQQLKQRLIEVRNSEGVQSILSTRAGSDPQPGTKILKTEADGQSPEKTIPTPTSVSRENLEDAPLSTTAPAETWVVVENYMPLIPLTEPHGIATPQKNNEQPAVPEQYQWQIAQESHLFVFLNPTLVTTRAKRTEEKPQAIAKIRSLEEVKIALENSERKQPSPVITAALAPVPLPVPKLPQKEEPVVSFPEYLSHKIKRNETLEKILKQEGIPAKEAAQWIKAAKKFTEFRTLRPGQVLELFFAQDVENPGLKTVTYVPEEDIHLILERKTAKLIQATKILPPTQPVWYVLGGRVEKSFAKSIKKTGIPEKLAKSVLNLEWEIDLSDLRTGDSFKILLEAIQRGQKIVEYKSLLAAVVSNHGETFTAFSLPEERQLLQKKNFEEEYRGQGLDIESEGEKFLRFPLQFSRISSSFSESRFHPILHRARRHNGIDFAAPRGTPVYSVAKGIVTFVGRQSGYGNLVKIDHPGPYETAYAHLQGFAAGIEEGAEIEKGNILGYVGSTGLATGPHLHFELLRDGIFVNPFSERSEEEMVASEQEEEPAPVDPIIEAKKKSLSEKLATLEVMGKSFVSLVIPQQNGEVVTAVGNRQKGEPQQAASGASVQR